jgi:4-amino-4-deoxy-L-arabinose transferase
MRLGPARGLLLTLGLLAALALAFQGSRGIWEPDEGFYVNVALNLLQSGDWLTPRLNGGPFLDKPPLQYWEMASGMRLLGRNEWGARLANAVHFVLTSLLVGAFATRLWGSRAGAVAAVVHASTLAPFLAANILTPDTPLATCTVGLYYAYWRARGATSGWSGARWGLAAGTFVGLGLLTKGAAMVLFAAPVILHLALTRKMTLARRLLGSLIGAAAMLAVAAPWYAFVFSSLPGSRVYMLDNQVIGRLFTAEYGRNPGWSGGLRVYLPMLLVGALPWSAVWLYQVARWASGRDRLDTAQEWPEGSRSLLLLWTLLPAGVLLVARSRLPLYILPLYAPIALATARSLTRKRALLAAGRVQRRARWALATWCVALVALKAGAAHCDSSHDSRELSAALHGQVDEENVEIVAVNLRLNGLPFYGWRRFEEVTAAPTQYPFFTPLESLDQELLELRDSPIPHSFVTSVEKAEGVVARLQRAGVRCHAPVPVAKHFVIACAPGLPSR